MKHVTSILLIIGTFISAEVRGQGFVYLSNTNQTVNSSDWTAGLIQIPFTTGSNTAGYQLDSLTVLFASNNTPVLTTAAVFDYSSGYSYFQSGAEVGSAGYYSLAPVTPISLAADTPYVMVVFPADAFLSVNWNYVTSPTVTSIDSWSVGLTDGSQNPLFSISATPVPAPEPAVVSLLFLGAVASFIFRIRHNRTPPNKSPEPTAVGAVSSAVAVHVTSRRWLSFFR
jgi:hypothetical protein